MTDKQKKHLWIAAGALVASYIVHAFILSTMQMAYYHQQVAQRQQAREAVLKKAAAAPVAAALPTGTVSAGTATPAGTPVTALPPRPILAPSTVGVWLGRSGIQGRGFCTLQLELRSKLPPGQLTGYSTLTCSNAGPLVSGDNRVNAARTAINRTNPEAAVLTGNVDGATTKFTVDQVISTDADGCAPTSFTVTSFGVNRIAAEWQENTCPGGSMILTKARQ